MSARRLRHMKSESGQAIVIVALGFVMLLAFTGIVVDVARVFVQRAQLRRAVDAAGLAATGQFRTGATGPDIVQAAIDLIRAHDIADPSVIVETCGSLPGGGTTDNPALCPPAGQPKRKLVRISAQAEVSMLFLQLVGINKVPVEASSTAEAAAVDAVLILDTSESQAYDAPSGYAYTGDSNLGCKPADVGAENVAACIAACTASATHPCYPLQQIKDAARAFVDRMYQDYDRVAVVGYDRSATTVYHLGIDLYAAKNAIDDLRVYEYAGTACPYATTVGERWKCGSSNPGGGLLTASYEFANGRQDSLWVALFLSSGGINATDPIPSMGSPENLFGYCPPKNFSDPLSRDGLPPCRDQRWSVHHQAPTITMTSPLYDAEDYAYDIATYMGSEAKPNGGGGMGVLFYTIALGQKAVCTTGVTYAPGPPVICGDFNPGYMDLDSGLPNTGELFLRYVADIGDNGKLNPPGGQDPNPCYTTGSGYQCGNYYFAPTGNDLLRIFLEIAGRIFTRISG